MSIEVICGDAWHALHGIETESVQCVVTSPPYWGLRDYGEEKQIGLEETPEDYVNKLVRIFQGVREVLREDGTFWLNLGDSYAGSWGNYGDAGGGQREKDTERFQRDAYENKSDWKPPTANTSLKIKQKDLVGIPWRVALALQEDGWYLRNDIIWHKPNPMPESVKDRCTTSHEHIFLLTKSKDYYYDHESIKEGYENDESENYPQRAQVTGRGQQSFSTERNGNADRDKSGGYPSEGGRNKRDVWEVTTKPFNDAHFAVFPPELPETCITAGTEEGDTVLDPFCGAGTTGLVADRLKRDFIGIDLNPDYCEMARERIYNDAPMMQYLEDEG